ncbi:uncharacterized protein LOC131676182 [Topomyia yanbarensis]|uniref:uncharacterized protein LOC131676182 n=1 Tax=Topomyia yanbarensis TaxID=2498891 RepID=UPI00273AFF46|nr:uncharacterized protein LOC131676182 [Topomyia yanbarensis]
MSSQIRLCWNWAVRTVQSLDDESDYFRPTDYGLVAAGIQIRSKSPTLRFLFRLYHALLFLLYFICVDRVYVYVAERDFSPDCIATFTVMIEMFTLMAQVRVVGLYRAELDRVRDYLRSRLNGDRSEERTRSYRLICRIVVYFELFNIVDQIVIFLLGIFNQPMYEVPKNLLQKGYFIDLIIHHVNAINNVLVTNLFVGFITIVNNYMMAFRTELKSIAADLAVIFDRVDRDIEGTGAEADKELYLLVALKRELCSIAERHSELLIQLDHIKGFFKWSVFCLFYGQLMATATGLFYINILGLTMNTVVLISYFCAVILECYWFCRLVDTMNDANERIGDTLYSLDWPQRLRYRGVDDSQREYREIRASMLTVMINSRNNLGISCGGLFIMSAEAFADFVKLVYQSTMFLLNMVQ